MRGGKRKGAGRPKGREPTKAIRLPLSKIEKILKKDFSLPIFHSSVAAGFPSPADDEIDKKLDLNELLIKHPSSTFFVRVSGHSMIKAGIHHGDILIVDRSLSPTSGKIVIAIINGELTVKRLIKQSGEIQLLAENDSFPPIKIKEGSELQIWGVVTNVIHNL